MMVCVPQNTFLSLLSGKKARYAATARQNQTNKHARFAAKKHNALVSTLSITKRETAVGSLTTP